MELPFLRGPLPEAFRRHRVELAPGRSMHYDSAEWCDALVVVEHGRLHLECHNGGLRTFGAGAVVTLDGLALRALHNRGHEPTVLVAVSRRSVPSRVQPRIIELPDRPYLGLRRTVTTATVADLTDRIPAIIGQLVARGVAPAGAPFLRYHLVRSDGRLEMEAGVPVDDPSTTAGGFVTATLPAGRFAVTRHTGHPAGLVDATTALLGWAAERGLRWDRTVSDGDECWGCRVAHFLTAPTEQRDHRPWETELAIRLF